MYLLFGCFKLMFHQIAHVTKQNNNLMASYTNKSNLIYFPVIFRAITLIDNQGV